MDKIELREKQLPDGEDSKSTELLVSQNRIVVYGSNLTGGYNLSKDFQTFLAERGIPDPQVQRGTNAVCISLDFFGQETFKDKPKDLPRGVIVLPTMRIYDENSGAGNTISTFSAPEGFSIPFDIIRNLCEQYDIPLVTMRNGYSHSEDLRESLKALKQITRNPS